MPAIGNGSVSFDTVAREWRAKYTGPAAESTSLQAAQMLLEKHLPTLKALGGEVTRQVCGGCLDFKVRPQRCHTARRARRPSHLPSAPSGLDCASDRKVC
eukprot:scaffold228865_cov27-Tisochrysis_lutea.AAC.3